MLVTNSPKVEVELLMPCYKILEQLIIINLLREFLDALLQKHGAVLQRRVHHDEVRIRLVLVAISTIEVGANLAHICLRQGQAQRHEFLHVLHRVRPGRRYVYHRVVVEGGEICSSIITVTATVRLIHTQRHILHHFHHNVETALSVIPPLHPHEEIPQCDGMVRLGFILLLLLAALVVRLDHLLVQVVALHTNLDTRHVDDGDDQLRIRNGMFTIRNRERRIREWDSDPLEPCGFDGGPEKLKHRRTIVGGNLVGEAATYQPVEVKKELA